MLTLSQPTRDGDVLTPFSRDPKGSAFLGSSRIAPADSLTDGIERRRGLRITQTRPIKVFEPTTTRYFGGQTQDVSSTGLRLELPASMLVRPGKLLSVHVGLSEAGQPLANRRQMIPARVVWVNRSSQSNARTLSAGVEFLATIAAQLDAA